MKTKPTIKIEHSWELLIIQLGKYYNYISRTGKRIGFNIDDNWLGQQELSEFAFKITFIDNSQGN